MNHRQAQSHDPLIVRQGYLLVKNLKFLFSGGTHPIPNSLKIPSSDSPSTSSHQPLAFFLLSASSLCLCSLSFAYFEFRRTSSGKGGGEAESFHRQRPNSLRCMPSLMALMRHVRTKSTSPVRARRAAPREPIGARLVCKHVSVSYPNLGYAKEKQDTYFRSSLRYIPRVALISLSLCPVFCHLLPSSTSNATLPLP